MTAPRDPIEAPAQPTTDAGKRFVDGGSPKWATVARAERAKIAVAIEAAARDEGRQEAVDTIRSRVLTTPCYRPGCICEDGPVARHTLHRILDDVARHGRSSDPTEADDE